MTMSKRHKIFLWLEQGLIPVVINFFINGFIIWLIFHSMDFVPLWGHTSIGVDILLTAFILPCVITIIASVVISKQVELNMVPPVQSDYPLWAVLRQWSAVKLGIILGVCCVVFCGIPMVWILSAGQVQSIPLNDFIIFKSSWAALLALLVAPAVGWLALVKASIETTD